MEHRGSDYQIGTEVGKLTREQGYSYNVKDGLLIAAIAWSNIYNRSEFAAGYAVGYTSADLDDETMDVNPRSKL